MNEETKNAVMAKLDELVSLLKDIGPSFKLQTLEVDENGTVKRAWDFDIFSYESTDSE